MFLLLIYSKFSGTTFKLFSKIFFPIICQNYFRFNNVKTFKFYCISGVVFEINNSCSFSPGLIPIILILKLGFITLASSVILILGILVQKFHHPALFSMNYQQILHLSSKVIKNRVIFLSVIVKKLCLSFNAFLKTSRTLPLEPKTFPYLTIENLVTLLP